MAASILSITLEDLDYEIVMSASIILKVRLNLQILASLDSNRKCGSISSAHDLRKAAESTGNVALGDGIEEIHLECVRLAELSEKRLAEGNRLVNRMVDRVEEFKMRTAKWEEAIMQVFNLLHSIPIPHKSMSQSEWCQPLECI